MISESLIIPHPNKQKPDDEPALLHETLDLENTSGHFALLKERGAEEYDEEVSSVSRSISQAVSKSLWFEYNSDAPLPVTEAHIDEHQTASCFGYAVCASECMEKAGIEHWVALANNHAFILVPLRSRQTTLLINPTNPKLDGEIPTHQPQVSPAAIDAAIGESPRGFAWFSADAYAKYAKNKDFLELVRLDLGGWLTTESQEAISAQLQDSGRGTLSKAPSKIAQERRLAVAVYTSQVGRDTMQQYGLFQHYVGEGDTDKAFRYLQELGALYPEIDSRSSQPHLMRLLDQLTKQNKCETACRSIDLVYSSLSETEDPRAAILRADLVRKLGRCTQDPELLLQADELYRAAERSTNTDLIARKRQKVGNIIANLKRIGKTVHP